MANNRFSFKGYKLKTWLFKNKDSLKLIVSGSIGLLAALVTELPPKWGAPLGLIVTVGSKLVIDSLDYWQSE